MHCFPSCSQGCIKLWQWLWENIDHAFALWHWYLFSLPTSWSLHERKGHFSPVCFKMSFLALQSCHSANAVNVGPHICMVWHPNDTLVSHRQLLGLLCWWSSRSEETMTHPPLILFLKWRKHKRRFKSQGQCGLLRYWIWGTWRGRTVSPEDCYFTVWWRSLLPSIYKQLTVIVWCSIFTVICQIHHYFM